MTAQRIPIVVLIRDSAPPRPACYPDDGIWHSWLLSAHQSGLRVVRRVDRRANVKYRAEECPPVQYEMLPAAQIPYCSGCLWQHQRRMKLLDRCTPCDGQAWERGEDIERAEQPKEEQRAA